MAITVITQPDPGASTDNVDYTNQNLLINGAITLPNANILTDWSSTGSAPDIALGAYIRHAGNLYQVDTADEAVTGTPSAGINYLKLSVSGSTLLASWRTSLIGYTYNEAYNGWYNGTDQVLFNGDFLDGALHRRFISPAGQFGVYLIADGRIYTVGKDILTNGGDIDTGGGDILAGAGTIDSEGGIIQSGGGLIDSEGGDIETSGGDLDTGGGQITATTGAITTTSGDISTTSGDMTAYGGSLGCKIATPGVPTGGSNGDIQLYWNGGSAYALFAKINGSWRYVTLA